jgi:class 3 adenylate cyclase/putative methionine-R-sulfoxide reductase with GAF domain
MGRRSKARRKSPNMRRHKAEMPKHRSAPAARRQRSSAADQEVELAQLRRELRETLEQQKATSEVLGVVGRSSGDLDPVFAAILDNSLRLCEAKFGGLFSYEENGFRCVAHRGASAKHSDKWRREPFLDLRTAHPALPLVRVAATKGVVHILDIASDVDPDERDSRALVLLGSAGARTMVGVPMFKDGVLIGAIIIYRTEVRSFTHQQIDLVKNFATQAAIAIENARLLNELRQRTADLSESLDQQTAASEILKVISSSPGELDPVFQTILENATRLCAAKFGTMYFREGEAFRAVAMHGATPAYKESRLNVPFHPSSQSAIGRVVQTKQLVQIEDCIADQAYAKRDPLRVLAVELGGVRTLLSVPMLKDNEVIGAVAIYRQEIKPFTDKQIALMQNFAAQAVIAIENARLLNELRQRTEEVSKLNQQLEQRVAEQVGEIERMGKLRRFLPPQVADLIVASGTEKQLESHRREITALFCDLRGFTGFSESSDPEDVMALLAEYHAAIGTIIIKYSGTLERYAGDGVMVIFNDPVPVENPALQAVLMALDMRVAIGALIEKWRDLGHDLGFGIGIAHGFATLGTIGFEGRRDYAAIGTVSNVASRLCDEAKPGQILISPRVRQAVEKAVVVDPVGEFALKGMRRPMLAYNVVASSGTQLS